MNIIKRIVPIVLALAAGFGLARVLSSESAAPKAEEQKHAPKAKIADKGDQATVQALRNRIAELERLLAARAKDGMVEPTNGVSQAANGPGGRGWNMPDPRKFFEEMKEKDPARYAQITNRMAKWQQRRAAQTQSRLEYLASIDTSRMSTGAKKVHDELQQMIAERQELEKRLQNPNLSDSERKEIFDDLHEMRGKMNELNRKERSNLLSETAKELGFSGDDVKTITTTIQDVIQATEGGGGHGPGGMPPPPPGGGGGGPR